MDENFVCEYCNNKDKRYFGIKNGKYYCRRCIKFSHEQVDKSYQINKDAVELSLNYPLSEKQKNISNKVLNALIEKKNVLISAVTGAGKTELIYESFEYFLKRGLKVGFATPRKDVVIDLLPRFEQAFKKLEIVGIYQNHTKEMLGDIIVLTTHQLCHFKNYFDLLVLDEIDAFPYANDFVLNNFFYNSVKGNYVMLSATCNKKDIENIKKDNGVVFELNERYHKHDLIVPIFKYGSFYTRLMRTILILKRYNKENKPCFVFGSTIYLCERVFSYLKLFVKDGNVVNSKACMRDVIIEDFKKGKYKYLVTTSILERGVTVKNLQVVVFDADSKLYDKDSLIQISGRVGRKIDSYDGEVTFFGNVKTEAITNCIDRINYVNKNKKL